jgi:S-adenosylmethionine:tRNA ribosyltransferase-isomerase
MILPAAAPRTSAKLLVARADGSIEHHPASALATAFDSRDLIVANDAATLPASLHGVHRPTGSTLEVRLAGWIELGDPSRFVAIAFGPGDHRTRTEDRPLPPPLRPGDRLELGPLHAEVERGLGNPRSFVLRFVGDRAQILAGITRHGRPIQYAHVPEPVALWDVWTKVAAVPVAFEAPSAAFAIDWATIAAWRRSGAGLVTLTHAAGLSSTGDPELDACLPFDEPYRIPRVTAAAVTRARAEGRRIVAIGTTVVRALESAWSQGALRSGPGIARGRIGPATSLRVVDAVLTGVHEPPESHYELLRAFSNDDRLISIVGVLHAHDYRSHEFGDAVLLERPVPLSTGMPLQ